MMFMLSLLTDEMKKAVFTVCTEPWLIQSLLIHFILVSKFRNLFQSSETKQVQVATKVGFLQYARIKLLDLWGCKNKARTQQQERRNPPTLTLLYFIVPLGTIIKERYLKTLLLQDLNGSQLLPSRKAHFYHWEQVLFKYGN